MNHLFIKTTGLVVVLLFLFVFASPIKETYTLDTSSSQIKWTGYHLIKSYAHWGLIQFKSGYVEMENGTITAGEFVIDVKTITCEDIKDEKDNTDLVNHLRSEDFFDVKEYPEAKLIIKKSFKVEDTIYNVVADLTIKGKTKEVSFGMNVELPDEQSLRASIDMRIQRTDFGVMYGWKLENAVLNDDFRAEITLVAKK